MLGCCEIYLTSVINPLISLWPKTLFSRIRKAYLFDETWVIERPQLKEVMNEEKMVPDRYIIFPDSADSDLIVGILNRETGVGLFNERIVSAEKIPFAEIVRLPSCRDADDSHLLFLKDKERSALHTAKTKLLEARKYNDAIRQVYDGAIQERELKPFSEAILTELLPKSMKKNKKTATDAAYFGTNGGDGPTFIGRFPIPVERYFIIKSENSTFPSQLLSRLVDRATEQGYDLLLYHCPFYPDEWDGVILSEIKTAVVESRSPHEIEPLHPHDKVISCEGLFQNRYHLFNYAMELREWEAKYKQYMRQAVMALREYGKYKRLQMFGYSHLPQLSHLLHLIDEK